MHYVCSCGLPWEDTRPDLDGSLHRCGSPIKLVDSSTYRTARRTYAAVLTSVARTARLRENLPPLIGATVDRAWTVHFSDGTVHKRPLTFDIREA